MKKFLKLFLILITTTLVVFSGCSKSNDTKDAKDNSKTLYFIPIVDTGAYWSPMKKGAEETAEKLGYKLLVKTSPPAEAQKNDKHIGFIREAIANKVAGIAIAPIEASMFKNPIKEAQNAGIPVVTFDADLDSEEDRVAYIGTNNEAAGEELGKKAAEEMKEKGVTKGSISIVTVDKSQPTMIAREKGIKKGFNEVMGNNSKNFKWLETIQDNDQAAISKEQLEGQITANKDLVVVFSLGSEGPDVGVMEALLSQNKSGKIFHYGFDYTDTWKKGIDDGRITAIVDQDAYNIGVQVIESLVKVVKGENIPSEIPIPVNYVPSGEIETYSVEKSKQMDE